MTAPEPAVSKTGWFADRGHRDDPESLRNMWQPCLNVGPIGWLPSIDIWFGTRDECEAFIREALLPHAGRMDES